MYENPEEKSQSTIVSVKFQLFFIFFTFIFLSILMLYPIFNFDCVDPYEEVYTEGPKFIDRSDKNQTPVKVGLNISNFDKFDMEQNDFIFSGIIFFEFNPSIVPIEKIEQFSFSKGKILEISKPHLKLEGDLAILAYHIKVNFRAKLNYKLFPIDDHRISIEIENEKLLPDDIFFDVSVSRFTLDPGIYISGWELYNKYVSSGYFFTKLEGSNSNLDLYRSKAAFVLELSRNSFREMVSVFLPLVLLFFISIFSFSIDPINYTTILGFSLGSITGMLSYKYIIEKLAPDVGYFMISDFVFFLFFILSIIIFFLNSKILELSLGTKKIIIILMHLVVVLSFIYLIIYMELRPF